MKKRFWMTLAIVIMFTGSTHCKERVISAGGSLTEILYELGVGPDIIAVDSSSYYPHSVKEKPQVGYFRRLSAEGVLALHPTLLVASDGAGPDEALKQIENTGVIVKVFKQETYTIESWENYINEVGEYFKLQKQSQAIISRVLENLKPLTKQKEKTINAIFLFSIGDRGPVAAGKKTVPNMLFELANMNNIANTLSGYKPYSSEELIKAEPDLIVMPTHIGNQLGGKQQICEQMIIKLATKNKGCNLLIMDGLLALGFGTRID